MSGNCFWLRSCSQNNKHRKLKEPKIDPRVDFSCFFYALSLPKDKRPVQKLISSHVAMSVLDEKTAYSVDHNVWVIATCGDFYQEKFPTFCRNVKMFSFKLTLKISKTPKRRKQRHKGIAAWFQLKSCQDTLFSFTRVLRKQPNRLSTQRPYTFAGKQELRRFREEKEGCLLSLRPPFFQDSIVLCLNSCSIFGKWTSQEKRNSTVEKVILALTRRLRLLFPRRIMNPEWSFHSLWWTHRKVCNLKLSALTQLEFGLCSWWRK